MISVGIPATTTSRGIGRVATSDDLVDGATINNGPAFLAAGVHTSVAAAAGKVPVADSNGKLDAWVSQQTQFATCATPAATAAKEATLTGFSLTKGARVFVIFANSNTVAGGLTLNVNSTGAKSIYNELGAVSASNPATFPAGVSIEFVYDGTNWTYRKYQNEFAKTVGGAPMYACRGWANINGMNTAALRAGGNVSSIADNGVGDYSVNWAVPMPDDKYVTNVTAMRQDGAQNITSSIKNISGGYSAVVTTSVRVQLTTYDGGALDGQVFIAAFR